MRTAAILGLALLAATSASANAAIMAYYPDANINSSPYDIDLSQGSTLTFNSNDGSFLGNIGVSTTGTTEVFSSSGAPAYFQPFATTTLPSQQLGSFQAYPTSTSIPFSLSQGTVGFEFNERDGTHYGLAKIGGSTIDSYYINSAPGKDISLAVPEPSTWLLMIAGIGGIGLMLRRAQTGMERRVKNLLAA